MNCPENNFFLKPRWEVEVLGGQKIKSPGNVMNCPENKTIKKKNRWEGVEVLGGKTIRSPGNFMNCRENRYIFFNPPPRMERGRGGRDRGRGQGRRKGDGGRQGRRGPSEAG